MNPLAEAISILTAPPRAAPADTLREAESEFAALVAQEEETEDATDLSPILVPLPFPGATCIEETAPAAVGPAGLVSDHSATPSAVDMLPASADGLVEAAIPEQPPEPAFAVMPEVDAGVGPASPAKAQPVPAPDLPAAPEALRPMVVLRRIRPHSSAERATAGEGGAEPEVPSPTAPPISGAQAAFAVRVQEAGGSAALPDGETALVPEPAGTGSAEAAPPFGATGDASGGGSFAFDPATGAIPAPLPTLLSRPVVGQVQAAMVALVRDGDVPQDAGAVATRHDTGQERGLELRLDPEELGRVSISMRTEGESLVVRVVAERPETLDLLRRHADQLLQDLRSSGFRDAQMAFGAEGQGPQGDRRPTADRETPFPAEDAATLLPAPPPAAFGPAPGGGLNLRF